MLLLHYRHKISSFCCYEKWEVHVAFVKMPKEHINLIVLQKQLPKTVTWKVASNGNSELADKRD